MYLSENALEVLKKRYLLKDESGKVIENPFDMFLRVAKNIAKADYLYGKSDKEVKKTTDNFYKIMSELEFLPNSPTLMNAGTPLQQLSACFVLPVYDDTRGIFDAIKYTALIHKSGGGTGFSFSRLRPAQDKVKSSMGIASGPISFMKIFNVATEVMKQGGRRRGANMAILRVDHHPDIEEFIKCKYKADDKTEDIIKALKEKYSMFGYFSDILEKSIVEKTQYNNFNISVAVTDEFMNAVKNNGKFDLINPRTKQKVKEIIASELFDEIVEMAWRNGEPGIIFLDTINRYNPTPRIGKIESTNPCGEQPLLPYESCNLGSINLSKFVEDNKINYINYRKLEDVVRTAVHFLDNVIDMNKYPLKKIEKITKANRKIGLGVMGFADMLIKLKISYNSEMAVKKAEEVMKFIRDVAREKSVELARERGVFPNFRHSIYDKNSKNFRGENLKLRNATLTTIAPTGTLSMIADCSSGIEPLVGISYEKRVLDGSSLEYKVNGLLEEALKEKGLYSEELIKEISSVSSLKYLPLPEDIKEIFVTAHDISPEQHIKIQAAFQRYTDNAVSKTINFPNSATKDDVKKAYLLAYELGCKGVTVYRDGSREEQVYYLSKKARTKKEYDRGKAEIGITIKEPTSIDGEKVNIYGTITFRKTEELGRVMKYMIEKGGPLETFVAFSIPRPEVIGSIGAWSVRLSKDLRRCKDPTEARKLLLEEAEAIKNWPGGEPIRDRYTGHINRTMWEAVSRILKHLEESSNNNYVQESAESTDENIPSLNDVLMRKEKTGSNYAICPECGKKTYVFQEGCERCLSCGYTKKGCG